MSSAKEEFIAKLEPLLMQTERALVSGKAEKSRRLSLEMLALVGEYAPRMTRHEMRDALNNRMANEIASRLGLKRKAR